MSRQNTMIMELMEKYMDENPDARKQDIYTKIVDSINVPRPTVRRVARDLRMKYQKRINQLQNDE